MYSICALASMVFFSDACWGGAFMDALEKISENSAVFAKEGVFKFVDSKAKDPDQFARFRDTEGRWLDDNLRQDAEVVFDIGGPTHAPCLQIGEYKVLGVGFNGEILACDEKNHYLKKALIPKWMRGSSKDDWYRVVVADEDRGIHLDCYWNDEGAVIVKDASVKSIAIHANFVHFLGDNHFEKATVAAPSGCTFWGSTTTANDFKIYSHSMAKLGGFLGGEKHRSPCDRSLTENELDNFVTTCPDYMKWLERYVYGSDVGFLNIGGRFQSDEVKTEDISFNIDGDTEIKKSLTQSGKNNKTIIRSRGDLAPIALQWLGYFDIRKSHGVKINEFIGTKVIKIAKEDNIGYSETIKKPSSYDKLFYRNDYIYYMHQLCQEGDNKLDYRNVFRSFEYKNGDPIDGSDLRVSNYPISVRYNDRVNLWFKLISEKQYQFWFEFNKLPIYYGPEANNRLNALLNFQIFGDYDERFRQMTDQNNDDNRRRKGGINPAYWYRDKDGQDEDDSDDDNEVAEPEIAPASSADGDKNDDNEVAEPEVSPVPSNSNNEGSNSSNTTNGQLEVAPGYIMNSEFMNDIKNGEKTQNNENNTPPEENASQISQVDFSEEETADDEDEGEEDVF